MTPKEFESFKQEHPELIYQVAGNLESKTESNPEEKAPDCSVPAQAENSSSSIGGSGGGAGLLNGLSGANFPAGTNPLVGLLVIIILIATVVVVFAFVSAVVALYNLVRPTPENDVCGGKPVRQLFFELGPHESVFGLQSTNSNSQWLGLLSGLQFSVESAHETKGLSVGVVAEAGYINYTVKSQATPNVNVNTGYWLVGPSMDFFTRFQRRTSPYFYFQTLAGTATSSDVGLISSVRLGFSIPFPGILRLAPEIGANYVRVKAYQGLLSVPSEFSVAGGLSLKYQF